MFGGKTKNRALPIAHLQYERLLPRVTREASFVRLPFSNAQHAGKVHCTVFIIPAQEAIYLSGKNALFSASSFRQTANEKRKQWRSYRRCVKRKKLFVLQGQLFYSSTPFHASERNISTSTFFQKNYKNRRRTCAYSHVRRSVLIAPKNFNFKKSIPAGSFHYLSFFYRG